MDVCHILATPNYPVLAYAVPVTTNRSGLNWLSATLRQQQTSSPSPSLNCLNLGVKHLFLRSFSACIIIEARHDFFYFWDLIFGISPTIPALIYEQMATCIYTINTVNRWTNGLTLVWIVDVRCSCTYIRISYNTLLCFCIHSDDRQQQYEFFEYVELPIFFLCDGQTPNRKYCCGIGSDVRASISLNLGGRSYRFRVLSRYEAFSLWHVQSPQPRRSLYSIHGVRNNINIYNTFVILYV